ncbi:cytochrome P450 [Aspergillus californicus]
MLWLTLTLITIPALYALSTITPLLQNLSLARKSNIPYILFPIYETSLPYILLFETRWFPYILNTWLPQSWADILWDGVFRGRWTIKNRLAKRLGGVYLTITPGGISCHVGDAGVVEQVCRDRRAFEKPVGHLQAFQMFGANVLASEGKQWAYHHRYTAPAFNEKNNALVWTESIQQAREMTNSWEKQYLDNDTPTAKMRFTLPDAREDILKLTLNIICSGGFGIKLPYEPAPALQDFSVTGAEDLCRDAVMPAPGFTFTFRGVMEYMNRSFSAVVFANCLLPSWSRRVLVKLSFFRLPFAAYRDLEEYLRVLVRRAEGRDADAHNLLEILVRSRHDEEGQGLSTSKRNPGLSEAEVLGNVYIFSLAGHETTATTLRFALVLLALHQDIQKELFSEIHEVIGGGPAGFEDWEYASVFPRMITALCIMLETLRLYPPVVSIPKLTTNTGATLTYGNTTHHLPPNVRVNLNANALHYSEEYWGPDAAIFNPRRWDKRNTNSFLVSNDGVEGLAGPGLESPDIHKPARGAYIPFSDGMRACMGKKFAQVEFVAALVVLLGRYRVTLGKIGKETDEEARRRVERALDRSSTSITLALVDQVPLVFHRRYAS